MPSFALGTRDPSHVDRFTPGLGGDGTNSPSNLDGVPDLQWRANINPTQSKAEQYNVRVDFNVTANDLIAFSMFRVPQSSDSFNGSPREMNAFHHTQLNEAETVIWNHVFSSSMLNEARANIAGWNWKDLENNPDGPWGLPSIYIQRVDGSGTIGTLQPDNHLDFGIGAPGPVRSEDHRRQEHADQGDEEPHAEDGRRDHAHDVRGHRAMVGAAVVLLQQHVGLPERRAVGRERDVRSAHRRADRLPEGHTADLVRAVRAGRLQGAAEPDGDAAGCGGSASDRSPRQNDNLSSVVLGSGANALTDMALGWEGRSTR